MSRGALQPSQQKLAEKLTILNDRGIGMLTRIYNIKKVRIRASCMCVTELCGECSRSQKHTDGLIQARPRLTYTVRVRACARVCVCVCERYPFLNLVFRFHSVMLAHLLYL